MTPTASFITVSGHFLDRGGVPHLLLKNVPPAIQEHYETMRLREREQAASARGAETVALDAGVEAEAVPSCSARRDIPTYGSWPVPCADGEEFVDGFMLDLSHLGSNGRRAAAAHAATNRHLPISASAHQIRLDDAGGVLGWVGTPARKLTLTSPGC